MERTIDDLVPGLLRRLEGALSAMQSGRYREAAPVFELVGVTAAKIGDVVEVNLHGSSAVECYLRLGDRDNAFRALRQFVEIHVNAQRVPEAARFGRLTIKPLRRDGLTTEADAVSAYLASALGAAWNDPDAPKLPPFCSNCGAAVKVVEVVRPTPSTAACKYCGASLDRR